MLKIMIVRSLPEHEMHEGKKEDCWLMEKVLSEKAAIIKQEIQEQVE